MATFAGEALKTRQEAMDTAQRDELMQRVFEAWRELRRGAVRKTNAHFYGTGPDALDPGQMDVLDVIVSQPRWRMSQLAQALYLDPSTMTRSVDRLADYGLVMRVPAADDGRGVQVRATPSGRALSKSVAQQRRIVMRNILGDMPRAECEGLALALEKMVKGVAAYTSQLGGAGEEPALIEAAPEEDHAVAGTGLGLDAV